MSGSSSGGVRCGSRANRTELQGWTSDHGLVARRPQTMKQKPRSRVNRKKANTVLRLPDLEHAKAAVLNSLTSADAQRGYHHAIDEFVDWYCSVPSGIQSDRGLTVQELSGIPVNWLQERSTSAWALCGSRTKLPIAACSVR